MSGETVDIAAEVERASNADVRSCNVCHSTDHVGRHHGATVCRSCSDFFRRQVPLLLPKLCRNGNGCRITPENRRKSCQSCRLAECLKAGMRMETVREGALEDVADVDNQGVDAATVAETPQFGPNTFTKLRRQFFDTDEQFGMSIEEYRVLMICEDNGDGCDNESLDDVKSNTIPTAKEAEVIENRQTLKRKSIQLSVVVEEDEDVTGSEEKKPKICAPTSSSGTCASESMGNEKLNLMAEGMKTTGQSKSTATKETLTGMTIMAETLANEARALYSDTVILEQDTGNHTMANAMDPLNSTYLHDTIVTGMNMGTDQDVVTSTPANGVPFVDVRAFFGNSINIAPKPKPGEVFAFSTGSSALTSRMAIRKSMAAKDIKNTAVVEKSESGVGSQVGQPGDNDNGHSHNDATQTTVQVEKNEICPGYKLSHTVARGTVISGHRSNNNNHHGHSHGNGGCSSGGNDHGHSHNDGHSHGHSH